MNQFEKEYYESESFWEGEMLMDRGNQKRIERTAQLIPSGVESLIDVGCGNGVFLNYLLENKRHLDLMGVDRSDTALSYVRTKKQNEDISILSFESSSFDCVSCLEVVEHLPVDIYEKSLSELARISRRYILLSVPYSEKLEDGYTRCPGCKSIFNSDLHLRSFDDDTFESLFEKYGYRNIASEKLGEIKSFVGHSLYRRLFYSHQKLTWRSPICPICGFTGPINVDKEVASLPQRKSVISYCTAIPKLIWPKRTSHYWILGLFERNSQ